VYLTSPRFYMYHRHESQCVRHVSGSFVCTCVGLGLQGGAFLGEELFVRRGGKDVMLKHAAGLTHS
jgi:hypothetical protein